MGARNPTGQYDVFSTIDPLRIVVINDVANAKVAALVAQLGIQEIERDWNSFTLTKNHAVGQGKAQLRFIIAPLMDQRRRRTLRSRLGVQDLSWRRCNERGCRRVRVVVVS